METSFTSPGLFIIDHSLYIFPIFWQVIPDMHKSITFLPTVSLLLATQVEYVAVRIGGLWANALALLCPEGVST